MASAWFRRAIQRWFAVWLSDDPLDGSVGTDVDVFGAIWSHCEIDVGPAEIDFVPAEPQPTFDVVSGLLSDLRATGGFDDATCIGSFVGTPAPDPLPD